MINQNNIIRDLAFWIEKNLDQPLSLDRVAEKSGYSKWHLQRMFKDVTGEVLGTYIRTRRLTKAAIALRLTSKPILDIALQYRFDSQQTFTRAFKKQFSQTPASFRRSEELCMTGMYPALDVDYQTLPEAEFVTLAEKQLQGVSQSYDCGLEILFSKQTAFRQQFWSSYINKLESVPSILFGILESVPSQTNDDEQTVLYTTALEPEYVSEKVNTHSVILPGGEYARFCYEGDPNGVEDFILIIYTVCLAKLNILRRKGPDIETFYLLENGKDNIPSLIRCEYFVPVRCSSNAVESK